MDVWQAMRKALEGLAADDLLRREVVTNSARGPRMRIDGQDVLCLCSNDYLSLASDPAVRRAATEAIERWGLGAGASRLVSGTTAAHVELERRLADFKHAESALVTPSGWTANHVAIHALAGAGDLVLCDKLDHASILDAARSSGAQVRSFPHRDTARLIRLLERLRGRHDRCLIVTDSLFSMDGDLAPLRQLVGIKRRFDAQLLIDEAHATGVIGPGGCPFPPRSAPRPRRPSGSFATSPSGAGGCWRWPKNCGVPCTMPSSRPAIPRARSSRSSSARPTRRWP